MVKINTLIEKYGDRLIEILSVSLLIFMSYIIFLNNTYGLENFNNSDIQRGFQRGVDVWHGVNSYLDFKPENMLSQEKVPGFFPLYFLFMAVLAKISSFSFVLFIDNLRYLVFICYSLIGIFIYTSLREKSKLLAIFGMFVFMFNRWTLNDVLSLKQESYVLLLLLISLKNLQKHRYWSFFLFGIATAIKHLTIFVFPLYIFELLYPFFQKEGLKNNKFSRNLKEILIGGLLIISPILVPSIPYFIDSPQHFVNSILYNVTRESESEGVGLKTGFDRLLILYNQDNESTFLFLLPRLPLIIAFTLLVILLFRQKVSKWVYCALVYLVFIGFNPTLFNQYYVWFMVFAPMALFEIIFKSSRKVID